MKGKFRSSGSGMSVYHNREKGESLIVTAAHMCNADLTEKAQKDILSYDFEIIVVNLRNMKSKGFVVNMTNSKGDPRDMCLIRSKVTTSVAHISFKPPKIGEKIYTLSAPGGVFHPPIVPILEGIYSGHINNGFHSLITIPAIGGSSGSGILNSDKELIGILFASQVNFHHITLMSSYETFIPFLRKSFKLYRAGETNTL